LYDAAYQGKVEEVEEILRDYPNINVNWVNEEENGQPFALQQACSVGHDSVVSLLLAHPDIDVNQKDRGGHTAFIYASAYGRSSCVRLLLKDSRVLVNERNEDGYTPLNWATFFGRLDVIKWWIASGREMDLGTPGNDYTDSIGTAKKVGETEAATLLERFKENPEETRYSVRMELGCSDEMAAEVFALVVFVSDGLLEIKDTTTIMSRFFSIARQLPLELQMVLCFRVFGSVKEIIHGVESEEAFKELATKPWPQWL